ncbi:MAG: putative porin [Candidatus Tectimicrobiota bacterium]
MRMKPFVAVGMGMLLLLLCPRVDWAQSEDRVRQLEQDLSRMRQDIEALKRERADAGKEAYHFPITLGASITVRYDSTSIEDKPDVRFEDEQAGFRTRDRFWAEFTPDGPVNAGIRLTTGENSNPVSPFVRFGELGRSRSFNLDQFWIAVRPWQFFDKNPRDKLPADVAIIGGRMPQPFWRGDWGTWKSEMIWDNDISPEGFAVQIKVPKLAPDFSLQATAGYFVIEEVENLRFNGLIGDTYMVAGQIKAEYKPLAAAAVSLYSFNRLNAGLFAPAFNPLTGVTLTPGASAILLRETALQRTNIQVNYGPNASGFVEDSFTVFNFTGQLHYPLPILPALATEIFLVGDYANNLSVSQAEQGYGITLGLRGGGKEGTKINPFHIWVTFRDVSNDATLSTFADSDLGAGTGYRGFGTGVNYRIHKNLLMQVAGFAFERRIGLSQEDIYWKRVYVDLVANF